MIPAYLISAAQCRAGRAFLAWPQRRLARQAGVARKTVADFEGGRRSLNKRTVAAIVAALRGGGLAFGPDDGVALVSYAGETSRVSRDL
jgi:DNA-binding XRE family transcriptional regulator